MWGQNEIKALGKGRVGKRGAQYVLYFDKYTTELLRPFIGKKVIVYIMMNNNVPYSEGISVEGRLSYERSFRPPRVAVFLPKALNPTLMTLYDRELIVMITVRGEDYGKEKAW
ncbi:hypothetical protein [Vulcanisaeta souniana]|uniref:Uncharacterized protein n=2 Tax=Vulcanisaeta souniana TaxID=164452 RepID=A0A830EFN9_9CREN|nr:hypothetical protein [Vulcanisaeta souniana]BDR93189.1 hypothetical protein Vsou_22820 [Vulcanisaeta souniana JCM 11219]GGI78303.1 hypothetical protein GCM10007112_13900 [Vulcanisaeta souniana JCM 11219]